MYRGEIWLINLDPTIGSEIKKIRPAIIVSEDSIGILPLRVIVPITNWQERYAIASWMIKIEPSTQNGLQKQSCADTFQVRSVAQQRFIRKLGELSEIEMKPIIKGLATVLVIN